MAYLVPVQKRQSLGYARLNTALARGAYRLPHGALAGYSGLGCDCALGQDDGETSVFGVSVDPTLLLAGGIALLGVFYLLGSGAPKRKGARIRRRIQRSQAQLRGLAV